MVFASKYGYKAELIKAVEEINKFQDEHLTKIVLDHLPSGFDKKISILGLAFKPKTPVITESPAIKLIKNLLEHDIKITVYDPLAKDNTKALFGDKIDYAYSVRDCVSSSNTLVVTTQDEEFKKINESYIKNYPATIIDCWRILKPKELGKKVRYIAIGKK